jgi:hypothetical protein
VKSAFASRDGESYCRVVSVQGRSMRWATVSPRVRKLLIRLSDTFWRVA